MYSAKLSIINESNENLEQFNQIASNFIENLHNVDGLNLEVPTETVDGTRGELNLWADIIVYAISTGTFMAIYTMAKDLFGIYANAEVQLTFEDGSVISLKHLTRNEAEEILRAHQENLSRRKRLSSNSE